MDGHPVNNSVYLNDIYTEREEAWKMNNADSNVFRVSHHHGGQNLAKSQPNRVSKHTGVDWS